MKLKPQTGNSEPHTPELPLPPVSKLTRERLQPYGDVIASDYEDYKRDFLQWLLARGKNTYKNKGYAETTVKHTSYKVDEAYRWKWDRDEEYTTEFRPETASELIEFMIRYTEHPDRYVYNVEKCVRRLFKFLRDERGRDIPTWDHDIPLEKTEGSSEHIKDKFYPREMNAIYEAALKKFSFPTLYSSAISAHERERLKNLLSARHGIPKDTITKETFESASSWKMPSMIAVTADTGLRPIEVGRAKASWFDLDREMMVVPAKDATKNKEFWNCTLSSKSVNAVSNWLDEREKYDEYRDESAMWLTRYSNTYGCKSLNRILNDLMDLAEVSQRTRNLSWYSFRHGAATAWINKHGLSKAKNQLRHKSIKTTEKYKREGQHESGGGESFW
jgi:integrase